MSAKDKSGSTGSLHSKLGTSSNKPVVEEDTELQPEPEMLDHATYQELQKQLTEAEGKSNQYYERMLRMQADLDNNQRRLERDLANAHKFALEKFVSELLPIIDNLERAIAAHELEDSSAESLLEGVRLTLKMFIAALEKFGVTQVNPEGEVFNPELHQAVSMQANGKVKPNTVINVLQKGYLLNNRLVRPAMVVVSQ